jgi:pimeloyl-ACP methyl ester carboxylesterase
MILCLHGALGTAAQFDTIRPYFPENIPVLAPTLPGHGNEVLDHAYSLSYFAAAVLDILDQAKITQTDIFGYSMGGYLALWLAWKHPTRVRRIVTLNTKLDWTPESAERMGNMFDPEKIVSKVPQLAEALAKTHEDWRKVAQYSADFVHSLGAGYGLPQEAFQQINCSVLVLRGELDTTVSEAESQEVAAWLPNGQYAAITGGKHALEQLDLVHLMPLVLNFLQTKDE